MFYFPLLLLSLYSIKEEIRISNLVYLTTLFLYLIFIFVPTICGIGYKTYEITKEGTLGFFNSANEISGIISILTPYFFIILVTTKKIIPKIGFILMYLVVILMMGTKTPLIILFLTLGFSLAYYWIFLLKQKQYKKVSISLGILIVGVTSILLILPKTNFYKNIETHLEFLEVDSVFEIFQKEELIDHFFFSQRLTFLKNKSAIYNQSNLYQKLFGIGYINNNETTKLIEMDYFEIFYSHGIIGFLIFFLILTMVLGKIVKNEELTYETYMKKLSIAWILFLSFFTGHILISPSVSFLSVLLILSLYKRDQISLLGNYKKEINHCLKISTDEIEELKRKDKYLFFKIMNFHNYDKCIIYNNKEKFVKEIGDILSRNVIMIKKEKDLLKKIEE